MPEHLRALVVILVLATLVFAFAKSSACALASTSEDFERRRNLWFGITVAAFLAHNFWIFIVVAAILLLVALPREPNKLAMFFFLLFAAPGIAAEVTGLGAINYFFEINYTRLLALAVLWPAFLVLRRDSDVERFGHLLPDKLIAAYLLLSAAMMLATDTFTNSLRHGVFYAFLDVFLPYYVASRSLKQLRDFRDALMGFAVAALVLGAIGVFEFAKHWLLYSPLNNVLDAQWGLGGYLSRGEGGGLRAQASTGHPIVLGYVMAVAAVLFVHLKRSVPNRMAWGLGLALLGGGLIASLSRGPWIGAVATLLVFIAAGPRPARGFGTLGMLAVLVSPALLLTPIGQKIIDYLPFVGTVEAENITYRQRLFQESVEIILENPLFGDNHFIESLALRGMVQGQGIVDVVNTYLGVGMVKGLVGLSLFFGFFVAVGVGIFNAMRHLPDRHDELHLLGRALFSALIGILVIIFTVSSISVIPVIYWSVAGLGVAYARMIASAEHHDAAAPQGVSQRAYAPQPYR